MMKLAVQTVTHNRAVQKTHLQSKKQLREHSKPQFQQKRNQEVF